ncbi:MAG TPA: epoxyqueuosine reductase [Anaerolineae bacterium]
MQSQELKPFIVDSIRGMVANAGNVTHYREPLVGFASAADPRFRELQRIVEPTHYLPDEMLPGAASVVSFFLPFAGSVVEANAQERSKVAREWPVAYLETNGLIERITAGLIAALAERGVRAAAAPATHNYDPDTLICRWSHKSVAVIAGVGSFGLHRMVITDSGCAGRFGSLVLDAGIDFTPPAVKERCLAFYDGSCRECIDRCPVNALSSDGAIDKQRCNRRLIGLGKSSGLEPLADACGKCAIGPCSLGSAVTLII